MRNERSAAARGGVSGRCRHADIRLSAYVVLAGRQGAIPVRRSTR